ncbi:MAG: VCBS repeat-containing protein [bacterium]
MKNEDSMKRCKGGKPGLIRVSRLINTFLFLFILSSSASAQTSVNGFCKKNSIPVGMGYNNIFVFDYNNDFKKDLLLYDNENKNVSVLTGERPGEYSPPVEKKLLHRISDIQYIDSVKGYGKIYIFTSRESRLVGVCNFSKSGLPHIISTKKFDSYPQNICVADINSDGKNEAVISGPTFDGLFIVDFNRSKIKGQSIINGRTFSNAVFVDLNYDLFHDIAACDLIKNEIIFFINRLDGTYRRSWSLALNGKIKSIQIDDFNKDRFSDIAVLMSSGFEILFGDSVSSFVKRKYINVNDELQNISFGDFNRDKIDDVAYWQKNGEVNIIFNILDKQTKPVTYIAGDSCRSLVSVRSRKNPEVILLSEAGRIYSIERQTSEDVGFDLAFTVKPEYVAEFDFGKNKNFSLGVIDNHDQSVKVLLGNNKRIISHYYQYKLTLPQKKLLVDNTNDSVKTFYAFSPGEKLIEVILTDFGSNKTIKTKLYSPYPIIDLKLSKHKEVQAQTLFVTMKKKSRTGIMAFHYDENKYIPIYYEDINAAYNFAEYTFNRNDYLYYWDFKEWKVILNQTLPNGTGKKTIYSVEAPSGNSQNDFTANIFSPNKYREGNPVICFIDLLVKKIGIVYQSDINQISHINGVDLGSFNFAVDYLSLWNGKGRYIFAYDFNKSEFYSADLTQRKNDYRFDYVMTQPGVKNYFITGNYLSKISVIFVNKLDNTTSIRKIE